MKPTSWRIGSTTHSRRYSAEKIGQGLPVWSRHGGDPTLDSNITRRVDFALFMAAAIEDDELVHEAPAIVGCQAPSALAHAGATRAHPDQPVPAADPQG